MEVLSPPRCDWCRMLSPHGLCWKPDPLARCRWCRATRSRGTGGPSGTPPQQSDVSQVLKNQISPPQKSDVCQGFKNSNLTSTTDVCQVQVQITPVSILAVCPGLRGCTSYTRTCPLALGMGWDWLVVTSVQTPHWLLSNWHLLPVFHLWRLILTFTFFWKLWRQVEGI